MTTLTRRQCQILAQLATGKTNAGIAAALSIEVATVKRHLTAIYARLGVPNRTAAAMWWIRRNNGQ